MITIWDGFTMFNELDMLRIRLEVLKDKVDYFVLCESKITFSGKPKPLYFEENKHLFEDFKDRIVHIVVEDTPSTNVSWDRERWQRNAIMRGFEGRCKDGDILLTGDIDEVPNLDNLDKWYSSGDVFHPMMDMFYYYLNFYRENNWHGTKICDWSIVKNIGVDPLRNVREGYAVKKGGWHWSYCSGPQAVLDKMNAFSDIELNNEFIRSHVYENIENGRDLFFRGQVMKKVDIDNSFPEYIVKNKLELINKGLIKE